MPNVPLTHVQHCTKLCVGCLRKVPLRQLSEVQKAAVARHIFDEYIKYFEILPHGICNTCRAYIGKPGTDTRFAVNSAKYKEVVDSFNMMPKATRSNPEPDKACTCAFCALGRTKFHQGPATSKRGRPRESSPNPRERAEATLMCSWCLQKVGPGIPHPCTRKERQANVNQVLTPKGKGQLASSHIRSLADASNTSEIALPTFGTPFQVTAVSSSSNSVRNLTPVLSHEAMSKMQKETGISDNQLLKIGKALRSNLGRKSIEANLKTSLTECNKQCSDFFIMKELSFYDKVKDDKSDHPSFTEKTLSIPICKNVVTFVSFVLQNRGVGNDYTLKVGMDGGGGSFKVTLNIIVPPTQRSVTQSPPSKKQQTFKPSGVKKLFLLAVAPSVPENYLNIKSILTFLALTSFDIITTLDLKLCNIICGLQGCSSTYPCYACELPKPFSGRAPLRTLGMCRRNADKFERDGAPWKDAKHYKSCVYQPLFDQPDLTFILDLIPPPELHLLLGVVNRIFDELNKLWGNNLAYAWAKSRNIIRAEYRGGGLEGNQCRKLLEALEDLANTLRQERPDLLGYPEALYMFNKVRKSCFGQDLVLSYKADIANFREAYLALGIPITPKVHIVLNHIIDFCESRGKGLGAYSEQATESAHYEFKKYFDRVRVSPEHPEYPQHLLKAMLLMNSKNL